jgi:hypothetical protein
VHDRAVVRGTTCDARSHPGGRHASRGHMAWGWRRGRAAAADAGQEEKGNLGGR